MQNSNLTPPPGLGSFDDMMPLKVELPSSRKPCYVAQTASTDAVQPPWMHTYPEGRPEMCYSPLNSQGLHRALSIIDQATRNVQQAKAMEEAMMAAQEVGKDPYLQFQCAAASNMFQAQLHEQQRILMELQRFAVDPAAVHTAEVGRQGGFVAPSKGQLNMPGDGHVAAQKAADRAKISPAASRKVQTLSTSLQLLSGEDPDCLFIVRRINKLGFKAVRTLKRHFSTYGPVMKVLLAHSTVRQHGDPACHARRRPSSLGFVQMGTGAAAAKVLALGAEQEVDGVMIRVQRFERQRDMEGFEDFEDELAAEEPSCIKLGLNKFERGISEVTSSTSASPFDSPSLTHSIQGVDMDSDQDFFG